MPAFTTQAAAVAYLTRDGADDHLACFSEHGATTRECAPVAWHLALIYQSSSGDPIGADDLDGAMSAVVNDRDGLAELLAEYADLVA
jgi:hypothetical protein